MELEQFKEAAEEYIGRLKSLVETGVKNTGDTSEDCHQIYLLNQLYYFEQAVNGTNQNDLAAD